jgi:hypothetical protein
MVWDHLVAQPPAVRLLVGVLAIGAGVVVWRLAPRRAASGAALSSDRRALGAPSTRWSSPVGWFYRIGVRVDALAIILTGGFLVEGSLPGG